ncbi:hypothetical protein BD410DRAFT_181802 [Rickenella mellea]|uniref:Uncharacterized protein n=1 Tax=Rickenella mellea TaxID=50990 RepID=A0A4Y7PHK1_9AGAM|nr:hypothetical protein BD410DRAFT_181802 [Rickenella mellea]
MKMCPIVRLFLFVEWIFHYQRSNTLVIFITLIYWSPLALTVSIETWLRCVGSHASRSYPDVVSTWREVSNPLCITVPQYNMRRGE